MDIMESVVSSLLRIYMLFARYVQVYISLSDKATR